MPKSSAKPKSKSQSNGANLGFEEKLWKASCKMWGHMDPAEYKHVALGLIFLKYISDAFEERRKALQKEKGADPEDRDEYIAENIFWVPKNARWSKLQDNAKQPSIGKLIDDAMIAIEKENPSLRGVLQKDYARATLDKHLLGELIDLIGTIGLGEAEHRSKDILGRVYEYFLGQFASAEGKSGGEFYTPQSVVKLLVGMIEPFKGRVYDPCCGSGGMFVQSEKFVLAHGGRVGDLSIYGQESNPTTWRLCKMNLAIRGIEGNIGEGNADSFQNDQHKDLKADFILANPPFNVSDWGGDRLREDVRWRYGTPPAGNANFAWVQHMIHHLSPHGLAGFVLANGSLTSDQMGEGSIRTQLIEQDLVDCIVTLPSQLFYSTQISACLWFVARSKRSSGIRDHRGEILFIDARTMGHLVDRTHKDMSEEEICRITSCYQAWRKPKSRNSYKDVPGFCKTTAIDDVKLHRYALVPGRYVGFERPENGITDQTELRGLVEDIERELNAVTSSTQAAIKILRELING